MSEDNVKNDEAHDDGTDDAIESGNDRVEVRQFDIVLSPGSSVSAFYSVVVKGPKDHLSEVSVSFVRTQDQAVVDTIGGATVEHPGQAATGAIDVLPGAFGLRDGTGAACLLTGLVSGKSFFFKKEVDLTEHPAPEA